MKSIEDQAQEYADTLLDIAEAVGSHHGHTSRTIVESADILACVRRIAEERAHLVRENDRLRDALLSIRDGDHEYPNSEWRIANEALLPVTNAQAE